MSAFALPIVLARAPVAVSTDPNNTTTTTTAAPNKLDDIVIEDDITTTVVSLEKVRSLKGTGLMSEKLPISNSYLEM